LRALPRRIDSDLPEGARDGAWEPYGIHGAALEEEEHEKARSAVVRRVHALAGPARALAPEIRSAAARRGPT
jgi:hypothetical protein